MSLKSVLVIGCIFISLTSMAGERVEMELPDFSEVSKALKEREKAKIPTMSCRTATGVTIERDQKGFKDCMNDLSRSSSHPPESSNDNIGVTGSGTVFKTK